MGFENVTYERDVSSELTKAKHSDLTTHWTYDDPAFADLRHADSTEGMAAGCHDGGPFLFRVLLRNIIFFISKITKIYFQTNSASGNRLQVFVNLVRTGGFVRTLGTAHVLKEFRKYENNTSKLIS